MPPDFVLTQLDDEDCNGVQRYIRRFKVVLKDKEGAEFQLTVKVYFLLYMSDHSTAFNPDNVDIEDDNGDRIIPSDLEVSEIVQKQIRDAAILKMREAGMDENRTIGRQYT